MVKRIVRMDLLPGKATSFLNIFETAEDAIRAQPGCLDLEIWQSGSKEQISVWTISLWDSLEALEQYRASDLFKGTWSAVKPLFSEKARAWTLSPIKSLK